MQPRLGFVSFGAGQGKAIGSPQGYYACVSVRSTVLTIAVIGIIAT